jgi:uncharacterized membrane protein YhaH (DUF805 family)
MTLPPAPPPLPPAFAAPTGEPPLWAPYYGASIGVAFSRFWKKYATFSGRASRSEFWWWYLIYVIFIAIFEIAFFAVGVGSAVVDPSTGSVSFNPAYWVVISLLWLVSLATLVPTLAISWRRLHDTNRSGGYYFLGLIPFVGGIILIVLLASGSDPAGARFDVPTA